MSKPKKPASPKPEPKKPEPPATARGAYLEIEPELGALSKDELRAVNLDIPQAVSMVLGLLEGLAPLRADIVDQLPKHDIALFDKLRTYALAAWFAHLLHVASTAPKADVAKLLEEATTLRENLLGDAEALAKRKLLPSEPVEALRAGQGNIDKANDLVGVSALLLANWSAIKGKTAATDQGQDSGHRGGALASGGARHFIARCPRRPRARGRGSSVRRRPPFPRIYPFLPRLRRDAQGCALSPLS